MAIMMRPRSTSATSLLHRPSLERAGLQVSHDALRGEMKLRKERASLAKTTGQIPCVPTPQQRHHRRLPSVDAQEQRNTDFDVMKRALLPAHHKNAPSVQLIDATKKLYDAYDRSGDGVIDVEEFVDSLRVLNPALSHSDAVGIFFSVNTEQSGGVKFAEFKKWVFGQHSKKSVDEVISLCESQASRILGAASEHGSKPSTPGGDRQALRRRVTGTVGAHIARTPSRGAVPVQQRESIIIQMGDPQPAHWKACHAWGLYICLSARGHFLARSVLVEGLLEGQPEQSSPTSFADFFVQSDKLSERDGNHLVILTRRYNLVGIYRFCLVAENNRLGF